MPGFSLGGGRLGLGGMIVVGIIALLLGVNPLSLLGNGGGNVGGPGVGQPQIGQPQPAGPGAPRSDRDVFIAKVLKTTEESWAQRFRAEVGQPYQPPRLVLFSGQVRSGCGGASAAMGPFYCPADQRVYLDTGFFEDLSRRFGAPGDFAQAYVIAHEVGHHVQTLLGINDQVRTAQARAGEAESNALQVRMELQADCLAGVWGHDHQDLLDPGDLAEGLRAAQAIGDDTLQNAAGQAVVPESFTHGSSAQRMRWLRRGFEAGSIAACDTFAARRL